MGDTVTDEVVLAVEEQEPVPVLEIDCHGGLQVVRFLTDLLLAEGVRGCTWQEFLQLTTESPLTALAAAALAEAPTTRTAAILLDQHAGALRHALDAILAALDAGDVGTALRQLDEMMRHGRLGRHLRQPWRVVVAGAPNVGKSSLVNALAGFQRSIVSPVPGTTRDVVTVRLAVDGWPIEVADTAGVRESGASLEEEGIRQARIAAVEADLCLWVLDAAAEPVWPAADLQSIQLVVNKVDLPPAWNLRQATDAVQVSAATGAGLPGLCSAIAGRLVPDPPPPGAAVPFTASLLDGLARARERLAAGDVVEGRSLLGGFY
jgi:tRNA modification GTPase